MCDDVDFANKIYTRFSHGDIVSHLLEEKLTGATDVAIIDVTELRILISPIMINSARYPHKLLEYTGANQNAITWLLSRLAGNPIARFAIRILPRLERKYCFRLYPLYISSLNNSYCERLTRLSDLEVRTLVKGTQWEHTPADELAEWFPRRFYLAYRWPYISILQIKPASPFSSLENGLLGQFKNRSLQISVFLL